ncbi:MAG TPA: hypothetical protein VKU02_26265 [Gemmataceae bacterium]|nr:hypothetical protein [Gemmataceae bacterium]
MSEILLSGLKSGEPIGFLAGIGLLRVCSHREALGSIKLGWKQPAGAAGVLVTGAESEPDQVIEEVLDHMRGRHQVPVYSGRPAAGITVGDGDWDDVKVDPELFGALLRATRPYVNPDDRESADFLAALGSELVAARSTSDIRPSALHMTSGNQKFLKLLRDLARSLDATDSTCKEASCPPADAFREALFGEWQYADQFSSLGYDPATEAIYALSDAAPADAKPWSTRAAVWLAVEAIPLFPCFPVGGRLYTRGFDQSGTRFRWPVWNAPLSLSAIRTLLGLPALSAPELAPITLDSYGISAVFEAERVTIGKGYGQFRPGIRVY